jgi:hypothetical protein
MVAVLALLAGACSSATGPTTDLILAGTWSGTLGAGSGGGRALRITWTISQTGTRLSGPVSVSTSPAVAAIVFDGTGTGTLTRSQLTMTLAARNGSSGCAVNGTGTAAASILAIDGTLDVTFTGCDGLDVEPPAGHHVTLAKR